MEDTGPIYFVKAIKNGKGTVFSSEDQQEMLDLYYACKNDVKYFGYEIFYGVDDVVVDLEG